LHRFFIQSKLSEDTEIILKDDYAHQIVRVLRMSPGKKIILLDNTGWEYDVYLSEISQNVVKGIIQEKRWVDREPRIRLVLYQSLLKNENFEWVLQKCTEIGVSSFVPILCERTIRKDFNGKPERWLRIIQEAAEQSGRGRLPTMHPSLKFEDALAGVNKYQLAIIPWEQAKGPGLSSVIGGLVSRNPTLAIFIGPEGGFSESEIEMAINRKMVVITLGKRILRSETAAMVTSALLLQTFGEMG
jgi:16S rRNA (uracil1498-N3)-methyltransferase